MTAASTDEADGAPRDGAPGWGVRTGRRRRARDAARARARHRLVLAAVLVVLALSAGLRLYNLGSPPEHMFDEVYYAKDARAILDGRMEGTPGASWEPGDVVSWPHPDAGKMAIALGILVAGDDPVGWRLPSVVAGLVVLAAVYPVARRLGLSPGWALVALLLASADLLGIAQSRIATLDVFVATWTALCVLFALKHVQRDGAPGWLALAGLCGGLAVATKWSGALAPVAALVLVLLGAQVRALAPERRTAGETRRARLARADERRRGLEPAREAGDAAAARANEGGDGGTGGATTTATHGPRWPRGRTVAWVTLCLLVLPLAVYLASYAAYFANGHTLSDFRELHSQMLHFNFTLSAEHSYASAAPTWILDYRPVWYSFREVASRFYGVVAIGNPFLWWAGLLALVAAPLLALRRGAAAPVLAALLVVVLYVPWFATTRTSFLYYMTPVAPFLAVLVAAVAAELVDGGPRRAVGPEREAGSARASEVSVAAGPARTAVATDGRSATAAGRLPASAPPAGGVLRPSLPARVAAVVVAALVAALLWYPLSRAAELVFWELPGHAAWWLSWLAAGLGVAAAVTAALFALSSRRVRPWLVLLALGALVGIAVPFLPIVLDLAISREDFYRLMWFPSWI